MNDKIKIKIIRKSETKIGAAPEIPEPAREANDESQQASTVSTWIDEFQQRRRRERQSAIEELYS